MLYLVFAEREVKNTSKMDAIKSLEMVLNLFEKGFLNQKTLWVQ